MSKARVYGYLMGFTPNCKMDRKRKKRPRKREGKRMEKVEIATAAKPLRNDGGETDCHDPCGVSQ